MSLDRLLSYLNNVKRTDWEDCVLRSLTRVRHLRARVTPSGQSTIHQRKTNYSQAWVIRHKSYILSKANNTAYNEPTTKANRLLTPTGHRTTTHNQAQSLCSTHEYNRRIQMMSSAFIVTCPHPPIATRRGTIRPQPQHAHP